MRSRIHRHRSRPDELSGLTAELLDRSVAAQLALSGAIEAVVARDAAGAAAVIAQHAAVVPVGVIAQPLAVAARSVRTALRIAAACERVGDHAVSIARSAQRLLAPPPVAPAAALRGLCRHACDRLVGAVDAYARGDLAQAQEIARPHGAVAPLRRALLRTILRVMADPELVGVGTELLAVSGHLEGVAEVGTAVACQVVALLEETTTERVRWEAAGHAALN
jgi:phosphate transport system protein